MNELINLNLIALGWSNVSFRERTVYQYIDRASQTNLIFSLDGILWFLRDGRPTSNETYYKGELPTVAELISLMLQHSGNAKS